MEESAVILQLVTYDMYDIYDMGKTCENTPYRKQCLDCLS